MRHRLRPETPEDIRAQMARLDAIFRDAGASPAARAPSPEEMRRVMARIRAAYEAQA